MKAQFTDLTFDCNGELFKAHKIVVCEQSKEIDRIVQSEFLVRFPPSPRLATTSLDPVPDLGL